MYKSVLLRYTIYIENNYYIYILADFTTKVKLSFYAQSTGLETTVSGTFPKAKLYGKVFQDPSASKAVCSLLPAPDMKKRRQKPPLFHIAQSTGLEPATSRVTGGCSNQLSYDCIFIKLHVNTTYILYHKINNIVVCRRVELNHRP